MKQKVRRLKYIALLLAVALLWIAGLGFSTNTILERALIVGMSIDKIDGTFKVGTQIIYPKGTSATKNGSQANFVVSEGKSLAEAVNRISEQTGLFPSLSHCNIVFIGEKMFEGELERCIDYLVRNHYLSVNTLLTTVKGEASEILKAKTDFTTATSIFIKKAIVKNGVFDGIGQVSIADFYRNYYSDTEVNFLNIIKIIDPETGEEVDLKTLSSGSSGGSSGGSSDSSSEGSSDAQSQSATSTQEKKYIFDATTFMLIKKDKLITEFNYDESICIDFLIFKIKRGSLSYKDEVGSFQLEVTGKKVKKTVSLEDMSIKYEIAVKVILGEFVLENGIEDPKIIAQMDKLSEEETRKIEKSYEKCVYQVLQKGLDNNVDIYDFYGDFYRRYGKRFTDKIGEDYLKDIKFEVALNFIFV